MKSKSLKTPHLIFFVIISFAIGCSKNNSAPPPPPPPTPTLSTDHKTLSIGAPTNSKDTFHIVSNGAWTASSDQSWLSLSATSGSGNAVIVTTATVNYGNGATRAANITVKGSGLPDQTVVITQDAGVVVVAGNGQTGFGLDQLWIPTGIFLDNDKNLYIAEAGNNRISMWTPGATQGVVVAGTLGSRGIALNQLFGPTGVFADPSGNIYVADTYNSRVVEWAKGATQGNLLAITDSNNTGSYTPSYISVDGNGNFYISEQGSNRVLKYTPGGLQGSIVAGTGIQGSGLDQLWTPEGIYLNSTGDIFIADGGNHRIVKWTSGASQGVVVAGDGTRGTGLNQFFDPYGVTFDKGGNLYVADYGLNRVTKWAPGATQGTLVAGGTGQGNALNALYNPVGIAVDIDGYIYISDSGNSRVVRWAQ